MQNKIITIDSVRFTNSYNVGSFKSNLLQSFNIVEHLSTTRKLKYSSDIPHTYLLSTDIIFNYRRIIRLLRTYDIVAIPSRFIDFVTLVFCVPFVNNKLTVVITDNWFSRLSYRLIFSVLLKFRGRLNFFTVSEGLSNLLYLKWGLNSELIFDMGSESFVKKLKNFNGSIDTNMARYFGGVEPNRLSALDKVISFLLEMRMVNFVEICCPIHEKEKIQRFFLKRNEVRVKSLPYDQIAETMASTGLLIFAESEEPKTIERIKYSLSTKVWQYILSERPIIITGDETLNSIQILTKYGKKVHLLKGKELVLSTNSNQFTYYNMGIKFKSLYYEK